jgi:hypothetical protein
MGGSTSGGSSGGVSRQPATIKPKAGTKPGEAGRYTLPTGGTIKTTTMDEDKLTAKRAERAASISERGGGVAAEKEYERESSIAELKGRLETQPPGLIGAIGRKSLETQIEALEKGATPVKIETPSGDFLTVGTVTEKGTYTGRSEYTEIAKEAVKDTTTTLPFIETTVKEAEERAAAIRAEEGPEPETTIITPEVTPEITPEADAVMLGEAEKTRRRRAKRAGAAGTLLEGGGVLYE